MKRNYRALTKLIETFLSEAWERFPEEATHESILKGEQALAKPASEETLPREQRAKAGGRREQDACRKGKEGANTASWRSQPLPGRAAGLKLHPRGTAATEPGRTARRAGLGSFLGCQKRRCPSPHWKRRFVRTQKSHTKLNLLQALDLPIDTRVSFLLAAAPPSICLALPVDRCDLKSQRNYREAVHRPHPDQGHVLSAQRSAGGTEDKAPALGAEPLLRGTVRPVTAAQSGTGTRAPRSVPSLHRPPCFSVSTRPCFVTCHLTCMVSASGRAI